MPSSNWITDKSDLPPGKGSYLLWIELSHAAPAPPRFHGSFTPGVYLYAGSAKGPGGLRARCGRHLTQDKSLKWHVDWLTQVAQDIRVLPIMHKSECEVVRSLQGIPGGHAPFSEFGSTDCKSCRAHLLMCPSGYDSEKLDEWINQVCKSE